MAAKTTTPDQGQLNRGDSSFRFLAAACRWPDGFERRAAILAAAEEVEDWDAVFEHGVQHRVMPLMANALRIAERAPPELVSRVGEIARRNALTTMVQASEAIRIGSAFDAEGIDWLTFKGPTLAMLAYGNLGIKASHDLDLLVEPARLDRCFATMTRLGYQCAIGPGSVDADTIDHFYSALRPRNGDGRIA